MSKVRAQAAGRAPGHRGRALCTRAAGGAWVLGAAAASVPSAFLLLLPLGPPVLFPLSGLLPLACLGFCVVSSRVRFLVRGALPRTAEWAGVSFLSLFCCCFAPLACEVRVWARARPKQSAVRVFGAGPRAC